MKNNFRKLFVVASALAAVASVHAATVKTTVHAPFGDYVAYLFRVGDANPTSTTSTFRIDGGKVVSFTGVSGGDWFIRVREVSNVLIGQTPAGHLNFYYSTPLTLPDLWL